MKVALYGNVCNNFYALAKCLRKNGIADAHLYLNYTEDFQHRPESDDPELKDNYPDWIHLDRRWDPFKFLKKFDKVFINELNKYDAVFLSDHGPVLAPYINSKKIFYVTGADLTRMPFRERYMEGLKGMKFWLARRYISYMQRKGVRHFDKIIASPFAPFNSALQRLEIPEQRISQSYYPILLDVKNMVNDPDARQKIDAYNREMLAPFQFVIFHPSRLIITKHSSYVSSGHWKGNDNLFKAFAIFLKNHKVTDACIAMPERITSPEIELAKSIIKELGIEKNIVWLKPTTPEGFPRKELIKYYSLSSLVADEFATGWFGSIVVEGMACSKPTLCYVDEEVMKKLYPWHPIISAIEPEKIASQIAQYYFDRELACKQGKISRDWALKYHSIEEGSKIYADNLNNDLKDVFSKQ
ncbi:MAG TPA: glycosyltransferase [Chitinophagaceae bacterium]